MRAMIDFFKTMLLMPKPWQSWLGLLLVVNMVIPILFINTLEAQVVLTAMIAGALTQATIFRAKGFVRLLGIGHIFWIPMIVWLWFRLDQIASNGPFGYWVLAVIILNGLSLLIDTVDVTRYIRGERRPHLAPKSG